MSDPGQQPPPASPPPEGQPATQSQQDDRIAKIEEEQKRQGGTLDQILNLVTGPKEGTPTSPAGGQPPPGDITSQVRAGVAEIEAGKKRDAENAEGLAWRKSVDDHLAEHQPRQPRTGWRAKMERAVHGRGPGDR